MTKCHIFKDLMAHTGYNKTIRFSLLPDTSQNRPLVLDKCGDVVTLTPLRGIEYIHHITIAGINSAPFRLLHVSGNCWQFHFSLRLSIDSSPNI